MWESPPSGAHPVRAKVLKWQEVRRATPPIATEGEEKSRMTEAVMKKGCERSWVTLAISGFRLHDRLCVPAGGHGPSSEKSSGIFVHCRFAFGYFYCWGKTVHSKTVSTGGDVPREWFLPVVSDRRMVTVLRHCSPDHDPSEAKYTITVAATPGWENPT